MLSAVPVVLLFLLALATSASAFQNGHARLDELARIYTPQAGNTAYESPQFAAAINDARLCRTRAGGELYPGYSEGHPAWTAYRNAHGQDVLWARFLNGTGNLAARPYTSNHGTGSAIDLATTSMRAWVDLQGQQFGIRKTSEAPGEWWHVNWVWATYGHPDPGISQRFPVLRKGSGGKCQGPAVKELQRRLGVKESGNFGAGTERHLIAWQRENICRKCGTGVVGHTTWIKLREQRAVPHSNYVRLTSPVRMRGQDVIAVQGTLNARRKELQKPPIHADGTWGRESNAALKNFQRHRHLDATGVAGPKTLTALRTPEASTAKKHVITKDADTATNPKAKQLGEKVGYSANPKQAAKDSGCAKVGSKYKRQECKVRALKADYLLRLNHAKVFKHGSPNRKEADRLTARALARYRAAKKTRDIIAFNRKPVDGGPDVSAYNPNVNWTAVKRAGYELAYVKATEGLTYTDSHFGCARLHAAAQAGLYVGAYHFAHPGRNSALAEAAHFRSALAHGCGSKPGRLIPTLDLEVNHGLSGPQLVQWATDFCGSLQAHLHRGCLLYTGPGFYDGLPRPGHVEALWTACYCSGPFKPSAFPTYALWQYTDHGVIPGSGRGDLNRFNGRGADLRRLQLR